MNDQELTADDNWCPDCDHPREACRCVPPVDRSKRCMLSGNPETPVSAFIESSEAQDILRMMCFQLSPIAHIFAEDGCNIPPKAEEEQSWCLRWLLQHALKSGTEWRTSAAEELKITHDRVIASRAKEPQA